MAVDRLISDFAQGTIEWLVGEGEALGDWVIVEGQGSLDHPAYSSVTLALIHGATPHAMVMVHKPGLAEHDFDHLPEASFPIASLPGFIELHERVAGLVAPSKVVAVALNTSLYPDDDDGKAGHRVDRGRDRPADRRSLPVRGRPAVGGDPGAASMRCRGSLAGEPAADATRCSTSACATRSGSPAPTTASERRGVTTVIVELRDDRFPGLVGVGEGYPDRFYGETPETMAAASSRCSSRPSARSRPTSQGSIAAELAMESGDPRPRRRELRPRHRAARPRRQGRRRPRPRAARPVRRLAADRLHDRHRRARDRRRARRPGGRFPGAQDQARRPAGPRDARSRPRASSAARSGSMPTPAGSRKRRSRCCRSSSASASSSSSSRSRPIASTSFAGSRSARRCRSSPTRAASCPRTSTRSSASSPAST